MMEESTFPALLRRVRSGDPEAARILVREFEPEIRRAIRVQRGGRSLGRVFDSMDVCQSVLAKFFVGVAAGRFELESPEDLLRLAAEGDDCLKNVAGKVQAPDEIVADRELLDEVRRRLGPTERYLSEQRALGRDWPELAEEMQTGADALRKKLTRAVERVMADLGLQNDDDVA
jgi:RNA polymerase sigma-70 factor (ECF subfamily)